MQLLHIIDFDKSDRSYINFTNVPCSFANNPFINQSYFFLLSINPTNVHKYLNANPICCNVSVYLPTWRSQKKKQTQGEHRVPAKPQSNQRDRRTKKVSKQCSKGNLNTPTPLVDGSSTELPSSEKW